MDQPSRPTPVPIPTLAEEDQNICTMEKMMFSELIGNELELTQCRLNGGGDCRFQTGAPG